MAEHDDARGTALFRWWLDLLDERHVELRVALNMKTGMKSAVLRFPGGERSPFPEPGAAACINE